MKKRDLLLPLSPIYGAAVRLRSLGYRRGWCAKTKLEAPVVSVGNLTFGGTGKTPTVIALVRDLVRRSRRPAVLTRGYGRQTDEPLFLVGPEAGEGPERAGDEPLELAARLPGVPIVVDADRVRGGERAIRAGADTLVLDDGFQHLGLVRDLDLVLLDAGDLFGGGRLPPSGRLREPLSALKRASAILVTKLPVGVEEIPLAVREDLQRVAPGLPLFGARLEPRRIHTGAGVLDVGALAGKRVFSVAALGRPKGFHTLLESVGAEIVGVEWFPDHHPYESGDIQRVMAEAKDRDAVVVTTAKDAVKWPKPHNAWVIEVSMAPLEGSWDRLWRLLREITG